MWMNTQKGMIAATHTIAADCCLQKIQVRRTRNRAMPHQEIFVLAKVAIPELQLRLKDFHSLFSTEVHHAVNLYFCHPLGPAEVLDCIV
jgi:hypothetical protein